MPDNNTKLVQVFDEDRLQVIATIPTVDVVRSGATNDTQITFAAMGREPLALVSWFYPGRLTGHEFLYSDQMEKRLSGANMITVTGNRVPFTPGG